MDCGPTCAFYASFSRRHPNFNAVQPHRRRRNPTSMKTTWANRLGALSALLLFSLTSSSHGALDILENSGAGDGLGDIWQFKWEATELSPTVDSDGDGRTNAEEAGAGTD